MRLSPTSLRKRLVFFVLIPVVVLLTGMGFSGFWYARNTLLTEWGDAAILRLQRAAHNVDMRLEAPKKWVEMLHANPGQPELRLLQDMIISRLAGMDGVMDVRLSTPEAGNITSQPSRFPGHGAGMIRSNSTAHGSGHGSAPGLVNVSPPQYHAESQSDAVTLVSNLIDSTGQPAGRLDVIVRFDYVIETVKSSGWWQSHKAFLVDESGRILAATNPVKQQVLGDTGDDLELRVLKSIGEKSYGIVFGNGFPVSEICGFYRLAEAPWYLVIFAPGKEILQPILNFRNYYFLFGITAILIIVALIHRTVSGTVSSIRQVSRAAKELTNGNFGPELSVTSRDEVGELIKSFNRMASQLQDRLRMKASLSLAMEIQQNFLPQKTVRFHNLDIAGKSLYCDETGGDYYDLLEFPETHNPRIGVAVGDGAEHGVAAALLMTTVRALLRSQISAEKSLADTLNRVNHLLCMDTAESGAFMTLFLMILDVTRQKLSWVRAGHDPAVLYDPEADRFEELGGTGMVLGLDENWIYEDYSRTGWKPGQIIVIGTDGIWETVSPDGEMYGKFRMNEVIRKNHQASAIQIVDAIIGAIHEFRAGHPVLDYITLVVIRICEPE
ncbi:MAG TPA: SpoIIE family protein phosphatase [Desulfatirhabdiaceae bacterium]|nr:SpoIIE family protein phosphatase [Desulfatirhabdiaceae bacterium]